MHSDLFESIIRTSGADTDDPYEEPSEPIDSGGTLVDLFEAVLREAVEEAAISEEKDAHERHSGKKGFEWYYFGSSVEAINSMLDEYESYFNKDGKDDDGNPIRYNSYKITDDKTNEIIGWFNYITRSVTNEQGDTIRSLSNIKLKQETPNSENDCFQQAAKHLLELFQNNVVSVISWEAAADPANKWVKQYASLCQRFGGSSNTYETGVSFSIPREAFIRNREAILKYFRLN